MDFEWSENARHILSLYPPWQEWHGYLEERIQTAERSLGIRLPKILRLFYRYWGSLHQTTSYLEGLAAPDEIFIQSNGLIFVFENQGVYNRAILLQDLDQDNPPIYFSYNKHYDEDQERSWELTQEHLSDYLDALTYYNAFNGLGLYSRATDWTRVSEEERYAILDQYWKRIEINSVPLYIHHNSVPPCWPIYIRPGQALDWYVNVLIAATRTAEDLDEISHILNIKWER